LIVQSLVGNLIYYSNQGRYEPRLAKSWKRSSPNIWEFEIYPDLIAEYGEQITAESFKLSIERVLRYLSKAQPVPVLSSLVGYDEFLKGKELIGIKAKGRTLSFEFNKSLRDGLLQVLSFAPFGYISKENLNSDGSWKNDFKFISSGPYKVESVLKNQMISISRRNSWGGSFAKNAPEKVEFYFELRKGRLEKGNVIVDAFTTEVEAPFGLEKYSLVPEWINPILLGNTKRGYFAKLELRRKFKALVSKIRNEMPPSVGIHFRSSYFYSNQAPKNSIQLEIKDFTFPKPSVPLLIEGEIPNINTPRALSWNVLRQALERADLPYQFSNNSTTHGSISGEQFDIRLRGASVGGGAEAWGLKMIFCSELGPKLPDPSGEVCRLIEKYEEDLLSDEEFSERFAYVVDSDSAIIPISNYGIQLYLSQSIDRRSLSPALSIIRFDQLELFSKRL